MIPGKKAILISGLVTVLFLSFVIDEWGYYAHRKINYYAALTIPPPLNRFFKTNIVYLSTHAVDPDRRRYAMPGEAPRHFIDLDRWIIGDTMVLTRDYDLDRILQGFWQWKSGDTIVVVNPSIHSKGRFYFYTPAENFSVDSFGLCMAINQLMHKGEIDMYPVVIPSYLYPDQAESGRLYFTDSLMAHGVLPYYFTDLYDQLVQAMEELSTGTILRICADIGHYVSDAHVPLHTTSNYNGQFTNQEGIHAFWESRIPELFEESHFNSLTGRSEYIGKPGDFIWKIIGNSYSLVPDVLLQEREARTRVPEQNHFCYEERGSQMVRTPCPVLAREYMDGMDGMVQDQWMAAIRAVGSVWYSAWLDAGQPELWFGHFEDSIDTSWIMRAKEWLVKPLGKGRSGLH